ncbi:MAG TPA: beta-N-acetylglucosaminidase [Prolixibacteraceae bacterium]|nr:beta-N-acetylglucosaminidase [Marinilabiliales bacterium]HBL74345.1 beta-N-acetylglucosaminidase [Prolixibacteraceae bacterium]HCU64115.1 beta-N-acetylglucosaminidase [Prolixibacteraceae bacterium]
MEKIILFIILMLGFIQCNNNPPELPESITIIPHPSEITQHSGIFILNAKTRISCNFELESIALQLVNLLKPATGFDIEIIEPTRKKNVIALSLDKNLSELGKEGYKLEVKNDRIGIVAYTESGIFYGIQTLRQLLPFQIESTSCYGKDIKWEIPCVSITDNPRFKWRGLMIDCSRTFWSKEFLKKIIRLMALYKMNILHLHLTDDQGWRIEINKYPELTQKGARFPEKWGEPEGRDGFYTQEDIKEVVSYAAKHNISVVPEIEMPGHTLAALVCYPELSCTGKSFEIHPFLKGPHIHKDIFCAGNEKTFEFLENVLSEVFVLFPSKFIHIGGDEAPKICWKACEKCQSRMKAEGLKDEEELQSWFIKKIEKFVTNNGKILIGWDEIMEGGLSKTATVMYWRGKFKDIPLAATSHGNHIIMCPTTHCYFDYNYKTISTIKAYEFEPIPDGFIQEQTELILGAQACFWSHIDRTEDKAERMLFPRLFSIAEVTWSPKEKRDTTHFKERVNSQLKRIKKLGIHYYPDSTVISN